MISVRFQGNPFNIIVIQVYAPTSNAEEAEVEQFYEDLQDLLELIPKKDVLFIIGDWNAKVGSQGTLGVTGKFGLGIWNEAGQKSKLDVFNYTQKNGGSNTKYPLKWECTTTFRFTAATGGSANILESKNSFQEC